MDQTTHCAEPVISPNWQIRASLTVPQDLRLSTTLYTIQLEWTPVVDATGYEIQHTEAHVIILTTRARLQLNNPINNVRTDETHTFRIRSTHGQDSSPWSDSFQFTIPVLINPPTGLQMTLNSGSPILNWSEPTDVNGAVIPISLFYEIEMTGYSELSIQSITYQQHGFNNLIPGKTYTFRVRASTRDGHHVSRWSQPISHTMQLETPNVTIWPGDGIHFLRWPTVQHATQYQVRKSNPDGYTITTTINATCDP